MVTYLVLTIIFCIIAIRVFWVRGIHNWMEDQKSDYMHLFNDNTIRRRSKRKRFMDYFKIWIWLKIDFLEEDIKNKLKNLK